MAPIPTTAEDLREQLLELFPGFSDFFVGSYFVRNDGSFTPCSVCSEFTSFYLERVTDFASPQVVELFVLLEAIVAADREGYFPVANAVFTCFLENVSHTKAGEASRGLMGPVSLKFFLGWHGPPPYER